LHTERTGRDFAHSGLNRILLGSACALALGASMTIGSPQVSAQSLPSYYLPGYGPRYAPRYMTMHLARSGSKYRAAHKHAEHASKLPFGDIRKGPMEIFISINQQRLHFYSDGVHVADAPVATGVPGHLTPLGVFSVIQRDRYHHSNIYSNAPMPYMERITWSGVALHEGPGVGHQASHGCIRMPHDFAARLWMLPTMGMRVIIARPELQPLPFADPHLFVHKQAPANPTTAPTAALTTTQQSNPALRTDVNGDPSAAPQASAKADAEKLPPAGTSDPADQDKSGGPASAAPIVPPAPATPTAVHAADGAFAASDGGDETQLPPFRPAKIADGNGPIAIFISRKTGRIYVRQNFTPVFDAPVKITDPEQAIGTHVFTAMDYLPDHSTFNWTVASLPGSQPRDIERRKYVRDGHGRIRHVRVVEHSASPAPPAATPQQALARIEIPQDAIDQISQLIVPGSSLIISDQGLGPETGEGTDFIVVAH
jgi:hypothetical protein